jgi:hypothetical protein|tara:strand:- start:877 stop:1068 length:192 start_codon:yes stop_codon:yes gene_type:complete
MAVTVKVIRNQNPEHDTAGTSDYAAAVDAAIGSVVPEDVEMTSVWDSTTNSIVTTIVLNTNTA